MLEGELSEHYFLLQNIKPIVFTIYKDNLKSWWDDGEPHKQAEGQAVTDFLHPVRMGFKAGGDFRGPSARTAFCIPPASVVSLCR